MSRCGECGSKDLELMNIKGSLHPWRDFSFVEITENQNVLVCQNCQNKIFSSRDISKLEKNIRISLLKKTSLAITKLIKECGITQEQLAESLGVTPEYISMVKNKKKILSFTTFNLLQSYYTYPELITKLCGININKAYFASAEAIPSRRVGIDRIQSNQSNIRFAISRGATAGFKTKEIIGKVIRNPMYLYLDNEEKQNDVDNKNSSLLDASYIKSFSKIGTRI